MAPTETASNHNSLLASATVEELTVAQILLELRFLMDIIARVPGAKWGRKRRRTSLSEDAPSLTLTGINAEMKAQIKVVEKQADASAAAATASPVTPLAFPPSEPDEKPRRAVKRSSRKKSKHEYIGMIEELSQRRDLLRKEVEKVTKHYNQLKAYNSQLKAMKQEVLNSCPMKEESQKERIVGMNLGEEIITLDHPMGVAPHPQPLVADHRMVENTRDSMSPITAHVGSVDRLGMVYPVGLNRTLDLNLWIDIVMEKASQPLDVVRELADRQARAAEARRRRMGIIKVKASRRSACRGNPARTR